MTDLWVPADIAVQTAEPSVHDVIDNGTVRAVFQPLVELATRTVVGYEALARGPVGTALENPMALLEAARSVGRLGELDWACRAAAAQGALDAAFDSRLTLFVNLEPDTLGQACPDHLAPIINRARRELRVVAEFTERSLARDPAALLSAVAKVRASGWGVALDDVGADPASLALLPFIRPDVVKLDLRLVQDRTDGEVAAIANAVRAYAEHTGATILAEGIETEHHLLVAQVLGATLGQGWLFGRPGPLPRPSIGPVSPIALLGDSDGALSRTPYELLTPGHTPLRVAKRLLIPMSHHLENQALTNGDRLVILGCFQKAEHFTFATRERYRRLAEHTVLTAALGVGLDTLDVPAVRGADLHPRDRLGREWNVLVVGPHFAGALVARDCGDDGPDLDRRFDFVITHDRDRVLAAARALLHWIAPAR